MVLALLLTVALAGAEAGGADYSRAIGCAAGEATLAILLGGDRADAADRDTVAQLNALSDRWAQAALIRSGNPAAVRLDLARSKASLAADFGSMRDPASLSARLDARLAACAAPQNDGTVGS